MRCKLGFAAVALAASLLVAGAAAADDWLTYQNDRYGTTIEYPDGFKMQRPPDSDDGRAFKSADGADFAVAALYNALDFTVAKYRDFTVKNVDPGSVITYETRGDNWFVISGTRGALIFYEKHRLSHDAQMIEDFVMSYPASLRSIYDPIVARMAKSFRPGRGFQSP
jgi:hypothetical protein